MQHSSLPEKLRAILSQITDRTTKAAHIAEAIRHDGSFRWVGIYNVDSKHGIVSNLAWSGPSAPALPVLPMTRGITSRAIAGKKTVNVSDVAGDSDYLIALDGTRAEIIVPVLSKTGDRVVGTIDVESGRLNAFDSKTQALLEECANVLQDFWPQPTDHRRELAASGRRK